MTEGALPDLDVSAELTGVLPPDWVVSGALDGAEEVDPVEAPIPLVERALLPTIVAPERALDAEERIVESPRPLEEACARAPRESDCVIAG